MAISCRTCFILFAHNYTVNPGFNSPCDKHAPGLPGSSVVFQSLDCNLPHFQLATRLPSTCLPAVGRQYDGFEDLPKILSDAQGSHGIICALRLRARPRSSCPDHVSLNVSLITRLINFMCMRFYQVPLLAARRYKTTYVPSFERCIQAHIASAVASRCLSGLLGRPQVECAVTTRTRDREDRAIAHGQFAVCATRR